jgi:hypothetical protein
MQSQLVAFTVSEWVRESFEGLNKCSAIGPKTLMRSVFVADFTGNDNTIIQSGADLDAFSVCDRHLPRK